MPLPSLGEWRKLLFSDHGRISRRSYWLYFLACIGLAILLLSLPLVGLPAVMPVAISLILLFPSYCVIAKRLHDIGIEGQWAIFMTGIAAIDALWLAAGTGMRLSGFIHALHGAWWWLALANTIAFFVLGLWPGEQGPNRFGPKKL